MKVKTLRALPGAPILLLSIMLLILILVVNVIFEAIQWLLIVLKIVPVKDDFKQGDHPFQDDCDW